MRRRRPVVRMPAAARRAFVVAVRDAKFFYLFYLGVAVLFKLGVAVLFYVPPFPWRLLVPHVEISYPGTRESAVQGEPQESDTLSCKEACPLLLGRAHFYKQYSECELCKLSKINRNTASLTNAGPPPPSPTPPPSPPPPPAAASPPLLPTSPPIKNRCSPIKCVGQTIGTEGEELDLSKVNLLEGDFEGAAMLQARPADADPSSKSPFAFTWVAKGATKSPGTAPTKNWSTKYAGGTIGMEIKELDLSNTQLWSADFGESDFEGA